MADTINAKMVRTVTKAGVSVNYAGNTGDSHFAYPVTTTLIKKMIDRGVDVYEQLDEVASDGTTEKLLTLEDYDKDNGGVTIDSDTTVVPDIEQFVIDTHAVEQQAFLKEKGLEIKERQESISSSFLGDNSSTYTTTTNTYTTVSTVG